MTARFANRIALVTGSSRGVGRATAERLASEGATVVVHYRRNVAGAAEVVDGIHAAGGKAIALEAELGDPAAIDGLLDGVRERFGRLDVLVANAAATAFRPLLETQSHHITKTFEISVLGFIRAVQRAAGLFPPTASIVAVSGFDAVRALSGHGVLGAAKAALEALVRSLAVELAPRGVRVNAVSPGYVDTDSARFYAGPDFETRAKPDWCARIPLGRLASPAEIATVISFLASSEASYVTGQTLLVDGGLTLS